MTEVREARGCRLLGYRRLRNYLLAALALLVVCARPPFASGSSGGAGTAPKPKPSGRHTTAQKAQDSPFGGRGMWIWYVSQSNGGNLGSIVATAHRYGIRTLMIKSGDGSGAWSQFSPQLVSTMHANGLRVCGWQYVYGNDPAGEAHVGAAAASAGADCLLIDAEGEYEGKYVEAQTYIKTLRRLVGASFTVALAGFPYVDYHPGYPYSVFLGPGGAQYNVPQMYWWDIGTTVENVYAHTYVFNRLYQRPVFPLGQVSGPPPAADIRRFRQLSRAYGATGVSWWVWQDATSSSWRALSRPVGWPNNFAPDTSLARLGQGAQGDVVVWAQEHLASAGQPVTIDGAFGPKTKTAVQRFQSANGLPAVGSIGPVTWGLLLRYAPVRVNWAKRSGRGASAASVAGNTPVPKSASLPPKRNEIARDSGRG